MKTKKWYKLKPDIVKSDDPLWVMLGLLFEVLGVKIEDEKLKRLPFTTRFLFEETDAPKNLTEKLDSGSIN